MLRPTSGYLGHSILQFSPFALLDHGTFLPVIDHVLAHLSSCWYDTPFSTRNYFVFLQVVPPDCLLLEFLKLTYSMNKISDFVFRLKVCRNSLSFLDSRKFVFVFIKPLRPIKLLILSYNPSLFIFKVCLLCKLGGCLLWNIYTCFLLFLTQNRCVLLLTKFMIIIDIWISGVWY